MIFNKPQRLLSIPGLKTKHLSTLQLPLFSRGVPEGRGVPHYMSPENPPKIPQHQQLNNRTK